MSEVITKMLSGNSKIPRIFPNLRFRFRIFRMVTTHIAGASLPGTSLHTCGREDLDSDGLYGLEPL